MNESTCHPRRLHAFVSGHLNEEETEALILHTSECESCFEGLNQLWSESHFSLPTEVPSRDPQARSQLEQQVFRSLHQENMWAQFIWLATKGILQVIFGVLRPFFNLKWRDIFKKPGSSVPAKE